MVPNLGNKQLSEKVKDTIVLQAFINVQDIDVVSMDVVPSSQDFMDRFESFKVDEININKAEDAFFQCKN